MLAELDVFQLWVNLRNVLKALLVGSYDSLLLLELSGDLRHAALKCLVENLELIFKFSNLFIFFKHFLADHKHEAGSIHVLQVKTLFGVSNVKAISLSF